MEKIYKREIKISLLESFVSQNCDLDNLDFVLSDVREYYLQYDLEATGEEMDILEERIRRYHEEIKAQTGYKALKRVMTVIAKG